MDLQAAQLMKGKRSTLSKLTVIFCLTLTAVLLIGSLVSPGRASIKGPYAAPTASLTHTPN